MPEPFPNINSAILTVLPEAILLTTVCVMLLLGPFLVDDEGKTEAGVSRRWTILSLITLAIAGWVAIKMVGHTHVGFFAVDGLTLFVRTLTFGLGPVLVILLTRQIDDGSSAEAHACLLTLLAGANFVAMATDLVGLFLALEMVSIPTYVYLYLPRRDALMQEAALKYFLLSVFSSAFVLFGMSWLFGAAGTTNLAEISAKVNATLGGGAASPRLIQAALAILIAGLSFRIAAVPFHFYAPDVFQGVNSASAAMLSVVPKIAGFAALFRVLPGGFEWIANHSSGASVQNLLAILAIITMTLGNLMAVRQHNLQRLLGYSSIAHSGYMLVGLAVGQGTGAMSGVTALWFYLATYGLVTVGIFALLAAANADQPVQTDADLVGLSQNHPAVAALLAVLLFSLTGLPPTAGFWGKLGLFQASWGANATWGSSGASMPYLNWLLGSPRGVWLASAIALNAAVAAWYYLRLIAAMYREPASPQSPSRLSLAPLAAGAVCAAVAILLFAAPQQLMDLAVMISPYGGAALAAQ